MLLIQKRLLILIQQVRDQVLEIMGPNRLPRRYLILIQMML